MKKSLIIYYSVFHPMILNVKQIFKEGGGWYPPPNPTVQNASFL